ncbi:MAG: hypothetical protein WDZ30_10995 [Cellvibrionaceae bacterium]
MFRRSLFSLLAMTLALAISVPLAADQLSDPTRPLNYRQAGSAEARLELNSILIAKGRRIAVINGQQVAEGERSGNIYVLRILPNRVIISRNGNEIELKLHNTITRKDAS